MEPNSILAAFIEKLLITGLIIENNLQQIVDGDKRTFLNCVFVSGSTTCHTRCQIKLTSSNFTENFLASVSIMFDSYNYSRRTGCSYSYRAHLAIDCSHLGKGEYNLRYLINQTKLLHVTTRKLAHCAVGKCKCISITAKKLSTVGKHKCTT